MTSKKQLLMENALELFAEKGFELTSVQEITDKCGMSKGAFYLSFKSKDELILALVDHFMIQIISEVDYVVRYEKKSNLLYKFYYTLFATFQSHSNFTKVFVKEQMHSFNGELMEKGHFYDQTIEKIIQSMITRLYGETIQPIEHDLLHCIKGFMKSYAELFIFYHLPLNLESLAKSLVEKTTILATYTTYPFVTAELALLRQQPTLESITKEEILDIISQTIHEIEEETERESLILLQQQVSKPTVHPVIIKGLIENIRAHPHCQWIVYLLQNYFELN